MKQVCFIIQGVTFLKSIFPLIIFSNYQNIKPTIFCIEKRAGKPYDDLISKRNFIESEIKKHNVDANVIWLNSQEQALSYMKSKKIDSIVCQDAHGHGRIFCESKDIKVYSIGVGFDVLHHANDLRLNKARYSSFPDVVYFPTTKIKEKFEKLVKNYPSKMMSLGSPIFDHTLFVDSSKSDKKNVTFLVTLQSLVTKKLQGEVEEFAKFCVENDIVFNMKTKTRTPWVFEDKDLISKINTFENEDGFPASSISLMQNSDLIISSYSTCAIEANYLGVPCINLDSVEKSQLTYAVKSIKFDYNFCEMYDSEICKTVSENIKDQYFELINKRKNTQEKLTYENNNSTRILKDIYERI